MSEPAFPQMAPPKGLDVHCEIDDGFALCGGNYVPRVPLDHFIHLGEVLSKAPPSSPRRFPWQRCSCCVAMIADEGGRP